MDTGRRPAEICALTWDCLARAADGIPVLVYDNAKADRMRRRLPIGEHTAQGSPSRSRRPPAVPRHPARPAGAAALPAPSTRPDPARSLRTT